ncbi:hypothetical protein OIO90_001818 [Microbotryomycetes sp. JL221]|nr:hypothetical protein OIO90_001818 [Microbotryomycetes sp. JL221]
MDDLHQLRAPQNKLKLHLMSIDDHLSVNIGLTNAARANSARVVSRMSLASIQSSIHDHYHQYNSTNDILRGLAEEFPAYAQTVVLGQSSEGRDILGLKVSNMSHSFVAVDEPANGWIDSSGAHTSKRKNKPKRPKRKHGFVIVAGQHAREWIAPATALYLAHDLLATTTSVNPSPLLNEFEFTFVPVSNPDGYEYTWSPDGDRLWRKNRQPVGDGCLGIDLNKNWAYKWSPGNRPNPCSDAYPGSRSFEAPELQAIRDYLVDERNHVRAFLDLHSFGQMIMYPFSYTCDRTSPDEENHFEAVIGAAKALRAVHGKTFETGSVCEVSLTAPGDSIDWTYAAAKIRWSFASELRGSVWAFLLPPDQIRPSGEEMSAALSSLANYIIQKEAGQR